ncbi:MAG TPA: hypothetical protein VL172_00735, partial [Kofleriaceae bacterium]|nr:hypothetical protein [Kofleriaceae bacterium]
MSRRGLPLQPSLSPWPPAAKRALALAAAAAAVLALGLVAPARAAPAGVVVTGPGHVLDYARAARRMIDAAQTRIRVVQFVIRSDEGPVLDLLQALAAAAKRGVDVKVCLDYGTLFESTEIDPKHEAPAQWLRDHG